MALRSNRKTRKLNPGVYERPDGKLQAKIAIPADVQFAYGRSSVTRSLKTDDAIEANRRHAQMVADFNAGFDLIRRGTASKAFEAFALKLHTAQTDLIEHRSDKVLFVGGTNYYLSPTWRARLDTTDPEELAATVGWAADWFYAEQLGIEPDDLPSELKSSMAYRQVMRECAEVLKDSWRAGTQATEGHVITPPRYPALQSKTDESADGNRAIDDRATWPLSRYCKEVFLPAKGAEVSAGTVYDRQLAVDVFTKLIGDPPVYMVTRSQLSDFQELLKYVPDGRLLIKGPLSEEPLASIVARQQSGDLSLKRLGAATINKHVQGITTLLGFARQKGHIRLNPALGMESVKATNANPAVEKRAFNKAEIETIFSQPLYSGCEADTERGLYRPGQVMVRDERFWIPVLLFLTGARASEIAGLEKAEVKITGDSARIVFKYTPLRRLKNPESERVIPLHPWAMKMGFAHYIASLPDDTTYLFPNIVCESRDPKTGEVTEEQMLGTSVFRQFNRTILKHVGLAADKSVSLHSMRHAFEEGMTGLDIPEEVMFRLTGRSVGGSRRIYAKSLPLDEAARDKRAEQYMQHVKRIDFGGPNISQLFI